MKKIILGTRGSALARAQTTLVREILLAAYPGLCVEEKIIATTVDSDLTIAINQSGVGGVGVFTRQLEEALLAREIDVAVHSLKDLPIQMPPGLELAAILPRATTSDLLISLEENGLDGLSSGALIGTSAPRRVELLRKRRSDLKFTALRGNVPTRLRKLAMNQQEHPLDAIVLARAGLERLGYDLKMEHNSGVLIVDGTKLYAHEMSWMLPAPGQGAIAVEVCSEKKASVFWNALHDEKTARCVQAERLLLHYLGGGCHMALGALATIDDASQKLHLRGVYVDGSLREGEAMGSTPEEAALLVATQLGRKITK
ncbi:MAG: hydroxymethylbilane synthase [Chthoniobacterales bacterium]